jgi:hypothetical protein
VYQVEALSMLRSNLNGSVSNLIHGLIDDRSMLNGRVSSRSYVHASICVDLSCLKSELSPCLDPGWSDLSTAKSHLSLITRVGGRVDISDWILYSEGCGFDRWHVRICFTFYITGMSVIDNGHILYVSTCILCECIVLVTNCRNKCNKEACLSQTGIALANASVLIMV